MTLQKRLNAVGNPVVKAILRSPLHGIMSGNVILISVTGRKSGRTYTTPVNYYRDGDRVTVISARDRTWWRNARGGAMVRLQLRGREVKGRANVIEDASGVAEGLAARLKQTPNIAKYFNVSLDADGQPKAGDIASAAQSRVIVQIELL